MKTRSRHQFHYILFYKPFAVLCQFTDGTGRCTLADFGPFPQDVYSVGRLDYDSEGLVLLTNDGKLKHFLLEPKHKHPRTYLAQVERVLSEEAIDRLGRGVVIEGSSTLPATVRVLKYEPALPPPWFQFDSENRFQRCGWR